MGRVAAENLRVAMDVLCDPDEEKIKEVYQREKYIDFMNSRITEYPRIITAFSFISLSCRFALSLKSIPHSSRVFAESAKFSAWSPIRSMSLTTWNK